jgi:hypothetical protein
VAPEIDQFSKLLPSAGTGLRYVIAKENNISLRFDAAWGRDEHTFYLVGPEKRKDAWRG